MRFIKSPWTRIRDVTLLLLVSRAWFGSSRKYILSTARATISSGHLFQLPRNMLSPNKAAKNFHVIYHTYRNSCPTTVHPLRRLLSFRRSASATLSLSIVQRVISQILHEHSQNARTLPTAVWSFCDTTIREVTIKATRDPPHLKLLHNHSMLDLLKVSQTKKKWIFILV